MFARKLMAVMVAFTAGLTSLGFVLAEDPKPTPALPVVKALDPRVPLVPAPIQPAQALKPREQVLIEAMCVQVPAGFCEESGLALDNPMPKTGELLTFLNRREVKMLEALLQGYPGRRILAEPRFVVWDGQTGSIQTTGPVEEVASLVPITTDGKTVYTPQTLSLISSHLTLQVTPKISKDNGMIELQVDRETANLGEGVAVNKAARGDDGQTIQKPTIVPCVNVQSQQTKLVLPDRGTVVIGNTIESARDKTKKMEMLWVLTAHVVREK